MQEHELLNGWIPYRLLKGGTGALQFRWLYVGDHAFTEPFFEESVAACLSLPQNVPGSFPVTSAETLLRVAARAEALPVTGIIYHISRCGSTLLSQLLACDVRNIVLSEVPLLDEVLRMPPDRDHSTEELFRAVLKLLSRKRSGQEQHVFIKTDSWHVLFHAQLHAWFPEAPSFLLYRAPREVGASQAKQPAMHSVPGVIEPSLFGLADEETMHMTREAYLDHVLTCYFRAYQEMLQSQKAVYALSYHDGPMTMIDVIDETCGLRTGAAVREAMYKRAGFHSKSPGENFSGDTPGPSAPGEFVQAEKMFQELGQQIAAQKIQTHGA
jgi:hypothetical protein